MESREDVVGRKGLTRETSTKQQGRTSLGRPLAIGHGNFYTEYIEIIQ